MPRNRFFHCLTLAAAFFLLWETQASAYETRVVTDHANTPLFQLRFFDQGEEYGNALSETEGEVSTWQLSAAQKDAVTQAVELWADILGPGANNAVPAAINVGTMNEVNADAISVANPTWHGTPWEGSSGLAGALIGDQSMNPPAQIRIGKMNFSIPDIPSPLPTGNGIDLVGTLYHEMGHALGISSLALVGEDDDGNPVYGFDTEISPWDRHLVDRYGVTPTTDMEVVRSEPETAPGADPVFTVGEMTESGVLFKGTHVSEVLAGALNGGLPIEGFEGDSLDLSHIELDRSLMSHQDYRNYQVFMEAELAALQDIGYTIDRKNFYGFSVYGDNLTLSNGQGYFARNADGTAYLPGQPNTAAYGVGLHIYGSGNDITQAADLLACGTAGTGIRVDGEASFTGPKTLSVKKSDGSVEEMTADAIIVATGSVPRTMPMIPGFEKTMSFTELLKEKKEVGDKVLFFGGGQSSCEAAYDLILQGKHPIIVEYAGDLVAAQATCLANTSFLRDAMEYHKVPTYLHSTITEIHDGGVTVKGQDGKTFEVACDNVINGIGFVPAPVGDKGRHVHRVGDCVAIGNLRTVIWRAWDVCMKI